MCSARLFLGKPQFSNVDACPRSLTKGSKKIGNIKSTHFCRKTSSCFFNVAMGSFFLFKKNNNDRVISALVPAYRVIPQNTKLGLANCIQHLYLTSYFRSFCCYIYIYMNRCVGIIFNAIYKPESCNMKCSMHSTTNGPHYCGKS